jgi:HEAT repeat protein
MSSQKQQIELASTVISLLAIFSLFLPFLVWSQGTQIEKLIKDLTDPDPSVRGNTAAALGLLKDARAVEPLIAALKHEDSFLRWSAALALDIIGGAKAQAALKEFLKDVNLQQVAADYQSFIRKGDTGTERLLIFVLHLYGNETMAADFLNWGNWKLEEAARKWAERQGYSIPSSGMGDLRWGMGKR